MAQRAAGSRHGAVVVLVRRPRRGQLSFLSAALSCPSLNLRRKEKNVVCTFNPQFWVEQHRQ